jgi:hypothetical protein
VADLCLNAHLKQKIHKVHRTIHGLSNGEYFAYTDWDTSIANFNRKFIGIIREYYKTSDLPCVPFNSDACCSFKASWLRIEIVDLQYEVKKHQDSAVLQLPKLSPNEIQQQGLIMALRS